MPGAQQTTVTAPKGRPGTATPAVSVVVCIYNVERYLRECLDSIAAQTFEDFECIMCDDESSDASGIIAEHFAAIDPRFRYVRQKNRGPGPAGGRNGGIPYIRGERILFVDSDDILIPDALEIMHKTAEATGSELVIGGVERFNESSRWPSFLHQRVHTTRREAITIDDYAEMVWDSTAWNKLIDSRLWHEHIGMFDEGRLYEDLYPMIRLMCLANSVDILDETIYLWRDREAKTSVTQEVASVRGLVDKVDQMLKLDAFLVSTNNRVAKTAQDHKLLTADIKWMLDELDRGSVEYQDAFWTEVPRLLAAMDADVYDRLAGPLKIQYELIRAGERHGLTVFRRQEASGAVNPSTVGVRDTLTRLGVDASAVAEQAAEALLFARVDRVRFVGGSIELQGQVALDRVVLDDPADAVLRILLESWNSGKTIEKTVPLTRTPRLHLTRQGPQLHRYTGFTVLFPSTELAQPGLAISNLMASATLEVPARGLSGTARLRHAQRSEVEGALIGTSAVEPYRDGNGSLSVRVTHPMIISEYDTEDCTLTLRFTEPPTDRIVLADPVLSRRWTAVPAPTAADAVLLDLSEVPDGSYRIDAVQSSGLVEPEWVPTATREVTSRVLTLGDRVVRWRSTATRVHVDIASSPDDFATPRFNARAHAERALVEAVRRVNKATWI